VSDVSNLAELLEVVTKKNKRKEALFYEGREIKYSELNDNASRVANGLSDLGIQQGDRVAIMLPNIPEFVYAFFGIQKLGAVAVPFNTLYKGREITHILNDSGAKAIVALASYFSLLNEVREEVPSLEHVILAGQRTLIFVSPESTVNVQFVADREAFEDAEVAYRKVGEILTETLRELGVSEAWYNHRGAVRVGGKKIGTILVSEIENLLLVNCVCFLGPLATEEFFRVIWVTPEVKDKVVEPTASVEEVSGEHPGIEKFRDALLAKLSAKLGIETEPGELKRDELFGYEKTRALAYRKG
jgi:hypothetical protein